MKKELIIKETEIVKQETTPLKVKDTINVEFKNTFIGTVDGRVTTYLKGKRYNLTPELLQRFKKDLREI